MASKPDERGGVQELSPVRQLFTFAAAVGSVAFLLNFTWEMFQMPFYAGMNLSDAGDWYLCFKAALGDMAIILLIYSLGRVAFGSWHWPERLNVSKSVYLAAMGGIAATYIELSALESAEWSYSSLMPRLPLLGVVGIVPLIQMILLPALSCKLGLKIGRRLIG